MTAINFVDAFCIRREWDINIIIGTITFFFDSYVQISKKKLYGRDIVLYIEEIFFQME